MAEEQEQHLAQLRSELADRLLLNRQRLEEEHATLVEAQAQVHCLFPACGLLPMAHLRLTVAIGSINSAILCAYHCLFKPSNPSANHQADFSFPFV